MIQVSSDFLQVVPNQGTPPTNRQVAQVRLRAATTCSGGPSARLTHASTSRGLRGDWLGQRRDELNANKLAAIGAGQNALHFRDDLVVAAQQWSA